MSSIAAHSIRDARAGEAAVLSAIARAAKAHWGYTDEWLARWSEELTLRPDDVARLTVRVADVEGRPAAFHALSRGGEATAWSIEHLWVAPAHMGRGLGRALVRDAIEIARRGGATALVADSDPNAEQFYRAAGFARTGTVSAPMPGALARVLPRMELSIAPPPHP